MRRARIKNSAFSFDLQTQIKIKKKNEEIPLKKWKKNRNDAKKSEKEKENLIESKKSSKLFGKFTSIFQRILHRF